MKKVISIFFVLVAAQTAGRAYAFDNSSLNGTVTCTSTTTVSPRVNAVGSISLVADGQGNWTSGSANYQIARGADTAVCNYVLTSGAYSVNADGSGSSTTNWSLASGSSQSCAPTVPNSPSAFSITSASFWTQGGNSNESGSCTLQTATGS